MRPIYVKIYDGKSSFEVYIVDTTYEMTDLAKMIIYHPLMLAHILYYSSLYLLSLIYNNIIFYYNSYFEFMHMTVTDISMKYCAKYTP